MGLFSRAQTFVSTQQLESVHWVSENRFVSSHNDGSYAFWSPGSDAVSEPTTLYGPFPCKAVTKIAVHPTTELVSLDRSYRSDPKGINDGFICFIETVNSYYFPAVCQGLVSAIVIP